MAEKKNLEQAQAVYNTLCQALDNLELHYEKNEEKLSIDCTVSGEDLPMEVNIRVDEKRMLVMLLSHIPLVIKEDKRLDAAIAVSAINDMIVDGSFDYDVAGGHIFFRMTNSFIDSKLSEDVFGYMLLCACQTIDEYNDKLLMLAKGMVSLEQFLSNISNN